MKKLISLALIVSCIFTFGNCSQNEVDKIKPYFNFTEDTNTSPEFTADGGTTLVSFETATPSAKNLMLLIIILLSVRWLQVRIRLLLLRKSSCPLR